jgi:Response regulator containing CheY-like receiver domain and AraC-type DNA-binding domain
MLFERHKQVVKRILIVEDEPLTAFDNENMLGDAGYEIVATIDDFDQAVDVLEREQVDLILSDIRLRSQQTGIELARAAKERGSRPCSRPVTPIRARRHRRRLPQQTVFRTPADQRDSMRRSPPAAQEGQAAQGP